MTPGSRNATHREAIERYVANDPNADVMDVLGALRLSPDAQPIVESIIDGSEGDADEHADGDDEIDDAKPSTRCDACFEPTANEPIDGWRLCADCRRSVNRSTTVTDMTPEDIAVPVPDGVEIAYLGGELIAQQPRDPETGVRTDPDEFRRFHELLLEEASEGYVPHYIRCEKNGKAPLGAPDTDTWKTEADRLTAAEAVEWLLEGGNVGIAGLKEDPDAGIVGDDLVDLDIDVPEKVDSDDVKATLGANSRTRVGEHKFYFGEDGLPNIDCSAGEVRTENQYVLAPGSHVKVELSNPDDPNLEDIPEGEREDVGRYTISDERPAAHLEYDELPAIYREEHEARQKIEEERPDRKPKPPERDEDATAEGLKDKPPEPKGTNGDRSSVFDLDVTDVTGLPWGYRGVNPIGHHSNDTPGNDGYFVLLKDEGVAHDHKDNVSYSAASYPLADAGERNPRMPNGGMTNHEYFVFWKYAKENNLVPDDDPIPRRALVHIAVANGYCDRDDVEDDWKLPREAFNDTLEHVSDEHGIDTGRDPLSTAANPEPVGPLAIKRLAAIDEGQRRRFIDAIPDGVQIPSNKEVSDQIREAVMDILAACADDDGYTTVQAPTGSNKSGVAAETLWRLVDDEITGGRPVVLFAETCDARDEVAARARDAGLDVLRLLGHEELCPTAAGEYDPANIDEDDPDAPEPFFLDGEPAGQWFDERTKQRGIPISSTHTEAERQSQNEGKTLPCCRDGPCAVHTQWPDEGIADDDGPRYDLVVATDPFAFVPNLRTNTNVIHDEQPDYSEDFGLDASEFSSRDEYLDTFNSRIRNAVTAFLGLSDDGPDTFEELVSLARECARCDAPYWNEQAAPNERPNEDLADRWKGAFGALEHEPDERWYFTDRRAHTLAKPIAGAIWKAIAGEIRPDLDPNVRGAGGVFGGNGRTSATVNHHPPRLDDDARNDYRWNLTHVTVTLNDENTIRSVRNAPDFNAARAVVGLDAHPTPWLWQRNVHPEMDVHRVLGRDEARLWRRHKRGQTTVGIGDATRTAGKDGRYFNERHARELIETLHDRFGADFRGVGCPSTFEDRIYDLMRDAGVYEPATLHYGEEKSRNIKGFADATVGLVYGCIDPGDDYVLDLLAECGLDAEPERSDTECDECDGEGCYACDGTGRKRAHGRGFVGPDADHAAELLESVRATHVAQMIGRFGRNLDVENGETNITFVATSAVPDDLVDYRIPDVQWVRSDTQRAILERLDEHGRATTRELADEVGCTKEHVRQTLARYQEGGVVRRNRGASRFGADEWSGDPTVDGLSSYQLRLDDIAKIAKSGVQGTNTWQLAIVDPHASEGEPSAAIIKSTAPIAAMSGVDPPPNKLDD